MGQAPASIVPLHWQALLYEGFEALADGFGIVLRKDDMRADAAGPCRSTRITCNLALTSDLPLVSPRLSRRVSITSSGQSKKSTAEGAVICCSKAAAWSMALHVAAVRKQQCHQLPFAPEYLHKAGHLQFCTNLGKPSIRNALPPDLIMAFLSSPMVTVEGTSCPCGGLHQC
jgi:hypothetical protein